MDKKYFILICCSFLYAISAGSQCQNTDSLWKEIVFIRDSSTATPAKKLQLLQEKESRMKNCPDPYDSSHAFLLRRIGAFYFGAGDYISALKYYQQSINLIKAKPGNRAVNLNHLVSNYYMVALLCDSLNRITEEMKNLDSCYTIARRLQAVDPYCLAALYKRAGYYYYIGDYKRCIEYAAICEELAATYAGKPGSAFYDSGMEYASSSFGWVVNSMLMLKQFEPAEKILTEKMGEIRSNLKYSPGLINEQLAEIQLAKSDYEKALLFYNRAYVSEHRMGNHTGAKVSLNNIGYTYFKKNENETALAYYKKALGYRNPDQPDELLNAVETLNILSGIGTVFIRKAQYDTAINYFDRALGQLKPGMTENGLLSVSLDELARQKKIGYLTNLVIEKGNAYQYKYGKTKDPRDIREAVRIYRVADLFLDRIRLEQTDMDSKLFWRSGSRRLYENAIQACYSEGAVDEAFYFFEKSRAMLLNDQLKEQHWIDEETINKRTQLKKKILQLSRELSNTGNTLPGYKELQGQLFDRRQELDQLNNVIRAKNPLYYQNYIDSTKITVQDIRNKVLPGYQGLLEIFSGDSAVYVLTVTPEKKHLKKINRQQFDTLSGAYISFISNADYLNRHFEEFVTISKKLYALIFNDAMIRKGRLIISPDGQYFPIESLVTDMSNREPVYFMQDYAVTYTYSARFLLNQFSTGPDRRNHSFIGIAPLEYTYNTHLASLNGSNNSLNRISGYFKDATSLVAANATKNNFLRGFGRFDIVQLYTHASQNSLKGDPEIYFVDSSLYLSDLVGGSIPATRLIVLSACETGAGKLYQGEGVFGFNRGFAALGIPASLTNLWSVDNESTYRLTELFYKYLTDKNPADLALQKAKIEFLKTADGGKKLPYYWASGILIGKTEMPDLADDHSSKMLTSIAGILAACIVLAVIYKASQTKQS